MFNDIYIYIYKCIENFWKDPLLIGMFSGE